MPSTLKLSWTKSPTEGISRYEISWGLNGNAIGTTNVDQDSQKDISGYEKLFSEANPNTTPAGGDVISASVRAVDANGNCSPWADAGDYTVSYPEPPQNVFLGD